MSRSTTTESTRNTPRPPVSGDAYASLRAAIRGAVHLPADDAFDRTRTGFQLASLHRPDAVVEAEAPGDVAEAVRFAAAADVPVAVQATGHGMPRATRGGILIDTRRLRGVQIDAPRRTAWVDAGTPWRDVLDAGAPHGLAPLSGSAPSVGAISYTLGGGVGLLAREHGFAADHVRAIDVVLADGSQRRVDAGHDPDLFWGLRGGRENIGLATAIEIDLLPIAELYGGGIFFAAEHIDAVVATYAEWTQAVPESMTSSLALVPFPDVPQLPEPIRGRFALHLRIAFNGPAVDGEALIAPLRAAAPSLLDGVRVLPYAESGSIHADPPMPSAFVGAHVLLERFDLATLHAALREVGPGTPAPSIIELRHLGGALRREPATPSAVARPQAAFSLAFVARSTADTADGLRDGQRRAIAAVGPWATPGQLLTFLHGAAATRDAIRSAYAPADAERLIALSRAHDPRGLFRHGYPLR